MNIPDKSFVGIVGESGCGKSTIASLLMGRNSLKSGSFMIAGSNITDVTEESLMKTLTYVGYNSIFFKGTVRDNLLLAKPDADDKELWGVLERCSLSAFLKSENGLETVLLENAGNLSGGQKQRLALARAILHDSPVYIFDEATSNIDVESEETVLSEIQKMAKSKTIIMISHRLANVMYADCIYCLESGNIAESGTHEELLQKDGIYAKLWCTQAELERFGRE
jgi:ABC-type multidrug transport system fused ATPase/permease subunit